MYRIYLRTFDQQVIADSKTNTHNPAAAAQAFAALVDRTDLDGQKMAAVLSFNGGQLAFHRFDRQPGQPDYWRGRLDEIEWPGIGRPTEMDGGKRVNLYLDGASLAEAARLADAAHPGKGNVSEGVRIALRRSAQADGVQQPTPR